MQRYIQAVSVLPPPLRESALTLDRSVMSRAEEVRLRVGRPMSLTLPEGERSMPGVPVVEREHLTQLVERGSRWSLHTVLDQLRQGFLTLEGGHRLGLCGTAVLEGGAVHALRDITGANLRIARQLPGVACPILNDLWREEQLQNTLILAAPGAGKTTLLRDVIRSLSNGEGGKPPLRVGVADERGELAACRAGQPQLDLGERTDVLDGCLKGLAIPILLRGMTPQVIAVDEITQARDIEVMERAVGCGVTLLATAHGCGREALSRRPLYRDMVDKGIFQRLVTIRMERGSRVLQVEDMP